LFVANASSYDAIGFTGLCPLSKVKEPISEEGSATKK